MNGWKITPDKATVAVFSLAADGTVTGASRDALRMVGIREQEIEGTSFSCFLPEDFGLESLISDLAQGASLHIRTNLIAADGSENEVSLVASRLTSSTGGPGQIICWVQPIAEGAYEGGEVHGEGGERRRGEEPGPGSNPDVMRPETKGDPDPSRREKLRGALEMAGATCHEFNQPMQVISGYAELLLRDKSETDPGYEELKRIKQASDRMIEITRKLMLITRYETRRYVGGTTIIDIDKSSSQLISIE